MAVRAQGRALQRAQRSVAARPEPEPKAPEPKAPDLQVAQAPAAKRRSISDVGMLLALGLFVVCLALAALHAVLVENQAALDDLLSSNEQRRERIDQLEAELAFLDSPEGLTEQAPSLGLFLVPELVVLSPLAPGLLAPPDPDAFSLMSSGYDPPAAPSIARRDTSPDAAPRPRSVAVRGRGTVSRALAEETRAGSASALRGSASRGPAG